MGEQCRELGRAPRSPQLPQKANLAFKGVTFSCFTALDLEYGFVMVSTLLAT